MTIVLKLGGSVITAKDEPETVDDTALDAVADAVAAIDERLVVIHGGGSFGHHHAASAGISTTTGTSDAEVVRAIHEAMKELNDTVVDALVAASVPAVPMHPLSIAARAADGDLSLPAKQVAVAVEQGFVPVLHGDIIVHESVGATILSGDELVVRLAQSLQADRVGVCSTVPGVYDADGTVIDRIRSIEEVADVLDGSDSPDVTGGMTGKVQQLLRLDAPAYIFDVDGLDVFLAGNHAGTRID